MTLERSISITTFTADNLVETTLSSDRIYFTLPTTPKSSASSSYSKPSREKQRSHKDLDKTVSDQTFFSSSSVTGPSKTDSGDGNDNAKSRSASGSSGANVKSNTKQSTHFNLKSATSGSPSKENPVRNSSNHVQSNSTKRDSCKVNNTSKSGNNSAKTTPDRQKKSKPAEIVLEFPSMPKSSNSHSSAAKRSEKSRESKSISNGFNPPLQAAKSLPGLAECSSKEVRAHSADTRPREKKSCISLFSFFRKKKKTREDRSPSPESKSHRRSSGGHQRHSHSASQPTSKSDGTSSSSRHHHRPSHSQSKLEDTPKSSKSHHSHNHGKPPITPNSNHTPTSTSQLQTDKTAQYSRSRKKHRGQGRGREHSHTPTSRPHSDHRKHKCDDPSPRGSILKQSNDRVHKLDDLPPHPSVLKQLKKSVEIGSFFDSLPAHSYHYKKAVDKTTSTPLSTHYRKNSNAFSARADSRTRTNCHSECQTNLKARADSTAEDSVTDLKYSEGGHFSSQAELNSSSRYRSNSRSDSLAQFKACAESSSSAPVFNESAGGSGHQLKSKSLHSASRTDLEVDSQCQYTISSVDQPRGFSRAQSLPRFEGSRFQPDADTKVINDEEDFEYLPTDMKGPLNLSLCGCGFLGMYHLGVVNCLVQRGPSFLEKVQRVAGASAGALMGALLVTAPDKMEESAEHIQNLAKEIRKKPLGALTPGYSFTRSLRYMLDDILPEDAHDMAHGRLYVSLTNSQTKKNELISDFKSREELIEALVASCYIPVYAGIKIPMIRGKKYMDGGLSDNLPRFESERTITVSPFDGKSDISPKHGQALDKKAHFINLHNQDYQVSMNNVKKGAHAFFPPKRHVLQEYFEKGRYDASRFLIREGLYEINVQHQTKTVLYESSV